MPDLDALQWFALYALVAVPAIASVITMLTAQRTDTRVDRLAARLDAEPSLPPDSLGTGSPVHDALAREWSR